jgi:anti-sigma B factor antagonist
VTGHCRDHQNEGEGAMNIEQRTVGDVVVVTVLGDITMPEGAAVRVSDKVRSLLQQGQVRLLLDLARVRYVDSMGLGELVEAYTAAKHRGGAVKLLNVGKRLNDLLVLTRLFTVFECFDSEAEAVASFSQPAGAPAGVA